MIPGAFPDKVTSDIDLTDEAIVQCDVPVPKINRQVSDGTLQMITNKF